MTWVCFNPLAARTGRGLADRTAFSGRTSRKQRLDGINVSPLEKFESGLHSPGPTRASIFVKQTEAGSPGKTRCTLALAPRSMGRVSGSQYVRNMDFVCGSNAERSSSRNSFSSYIDLVKIYFWLPSLTASDRFQREQPRMCHHSLLMIDDVIVFPTTVAQWQSALHVMRWSRVRPTVWPFLSLPTDCAAFTLRSDLCAFRL